MKNRNSPGKDDRGIILIIVLWVLFFLSIVVLTLGFKNRINIRLRSMNNEQLRSFYLAKEGISRTLLKLGEDNNGFDSLSDEWSKNLLLENDYGMLSVEVIDEDRFLNVNLISRGMFDGVGELFDDMQEKDLEAIYKRRPFNVASELKYIDLIDDDKFDIMTSDGKAKLYDLLTTFSDGRININTASKEVLSMIPGMSQKTIEAIIDRRSSTPFEDQDALSEELSLIGLTPEQVGSLIKVAKVSSSAFRIRSLAVSSGRSIEKLIEIVIRRDEDGFQILYAGEN